MKFTVYVTSIQSYMLLHPLLKLNVVLVCDNYQFNCVSVCAQRTWSSALGHPGQSARSLLERSKLDLNVNHQLHNTYDPLGLAGLFCAGVSIQLGMS